MEANADYLEVKQQYHLEGRLMADNYWVQGCSGLGGAYAQVGEWGGAEAWLAAGEGGPGEAVHMWARRHWAGDSNKTCRSNGKGSN